MKIRMNTSVAVAGTALSRDQVVEVTDGVGAALVKAGHAEEIKGRRTHDDGEDDFAGLTLKELRAELEHRGLPSDGRKPELLARLRAAEAAEDETPAEEPAEDEAPEDGASTEDGAGDDGTADAEAEDGADTEAADDE